MCYIMLFKFILGDPFNVSESQESPSVSMWPSNGENVVVNQLYNY